MSEQERKHPARASQHKKQKKAREEKEKV